VLLSHFPSSAVHRCTDSMADIEKQSSSPTGHPSLDSSSPLFSPQTSSSQSVELLAHSPTDPHHKMNAWLTVAGSFLALFCSFGQMIAFGTFQSWHSTHELSYLSEFKISWIGSLQLCAFFFMVCWAQCYYGGEKLTVRLPCGRVALLDGCSMCMGPCHSW